MSSPPYLRMMGDAAAYTASESRSTSFGDSIASSAPSSANPKRSSETSLRLRIIVLVEWLRTLCLLRCTATSITKRMMPWRTRMDTTDSTEKNRDVSTNGSRYDRRRMVSMTMMTKGIKSPMRNPISEYLRIFCTNVALRGAVRRRNSPQMRRWLASTSTLVTLNAPQTRAKRDSRRETFFHSRNSLSMPLKRPSKYAVTRMFCATCVPRHATSRTPMIWMRGSGSSMRATASNRREALLATVDKAIIAGSIERTDAFITVRCKAARSPWFAKYSMANRTSSLLVSCRLPSGVWTNIMRTSPGRSFRCTRHLRSSMLWTASVTR
mmetsp:Transcript_48530/g.149811  ORF Transcript_48530/g.149811 Transcript_48530/m.149811 type:complete len:324 (+) Transcript_48530:1442-2413(+)